MNLSYATFAFNAGEVTHISFRRELGMSPRNTAFTERRVLEFRGMIVASGQANINARAAAIRAGLALNGAGDVALLKDDASTTEIILTNSDSFTGVRVTRRPSFDVRGGNGSFVTGLTFGGEFQAEYLVDVTADRYLDYEDSITVQGDGGAIRVVRPVDFGQWVEQQVTTTSPIIVIQEGSSLARADFPRIGGNPALEPVAADPIFPDRILNPMQDKQIGEKTPKMNGTIFLGYGLSWRYTMTLLDSTVFIPHPVFN